MNKSCLFLGSRNFKSSKGKNLSEDFESAFASALQETNYLSPIYMPSDLILDNKSYKFIEHLMDDDLVIANLTNEMPSLYYQLSIRHFLEKPIIHIISDKDTFFDLSDPKFYYIHVSAFKDFQSIKDEMLSKIKLFNENKDYSLHHISFIRKTEKIYEKNTFKLMLSNKFITHSKEDEEMIIYPNLHVSTFVERRLSKNELMRSQKQ